MPALEAPPAERQPPLGWARAVPGLLIDLGQMAAALGLRDQELVELRDWINASFVPAVWDEGAAILIDPGLGGEGSHDDMPSSIWEPLLQTCRVNWPPAPVGSMAPHIQVRLDLASCAELLGEHGLWQPPAGLLPAHALPPRDR